MALGMCMPDDFPDEFPDRCPACDRRSSAGGPFCPFCGEPYFSVEDDDDGDE